MVTMGGWRNGSLALLLGLLLFIHAFTIAELAERPLTDFPTLYLSARFVWEGRGIYSATDADLASILPGTEAPHGEPLNPNLNPPFQAVAMAPLGLLPYPAAFWLWSLLSLAAAVGGALLVERATRKVGGNGGRWLTFVVVLLAYFPTWATLAYGQLSLLLFLLVSAGWLAARRGRDGLAGIVLGLALSLKLFTGLFVLLFLLQRRWRLLLWLGGAFVVCTLAALPAGGLESYRQYRAILGGTDWYAASWNASFAGFFARIFGGSRNVPLFDSPLLAQLLTAAATAGTVALLVWVVLAQGRVTVAVRFDVGFAATVVAMLLVSPLGWMYYFPLLLIPGAVLWRLAEDLPSPRRWRASVVLAWLLSTTPHLLVPSARFNDPVGWFTYAGAYFYALLVFGGMLVAVMKQADQPIPRLDRLLGSGGVEPAA